MKVKSAKAGRHDVRDKFNENLSVGSKLFRDGRKLTYACNVTIKVHLSPYKKFK
jgi:hypothetical protein